MPKNALRKDELEQWTHGRPNAISEILINGFALLRETATERDGEGEKAKYKVDGKEVTDTYKKVITNIFNKFTLKGTEKITIRDHEREIDGSALLGAYFRSHLLGADGQNIVELSEVELQAVYDFVAPLVPREPIGLTAKMWLESFTGSAQERHKKVIQGLVFQGISAEEYANMFKGKYKADVENMLDSMLNVIDFMRTPLRILDSEEAALKAEAKKMGGVAKTSGVDLQWTSMLKAFQGSMNTMITKKHGSKQKTDAEKLNEGIRETLMWCQGSFGIENERYKLRTEFAAEMAKNQVAFKQIITMLGFSEEEPEKALPILSQYVNNFRENIIKSHPEKEEAIQVLTLTQLIANYAAEWQIQYDVLNIKAEAAQKEITALKEQLVLISSTVEQQKSQLTQKTLELDSSKKLVLALQTQLHEDQETAKTSASLQKLITEKSSSLATAQQKVQSVEAELRSMTQKVQETEQQKQQIAELLQRINQLEQQLHSAQEKGSSAEALEAQLKKAQLENNELLSQLELARSTKETILVEDHSQELETLRHENTHLKEQLELAGRTKELEVTKHPEDEPKPLKVAPQIVDPELSEVNDKKMKLFIELGGIKETLKTEEFNKIKNQIAQGNSTADLELAEHEIQYLKKVNKFITNINEGILQRAGFFSSDPYKKTKAIETAYQELTMQEKVKLMLLDNDQIKQELDQDKKSSIGTLLHEVHHNRGWLSFFGEATSFTMFKTEIAKKDVPEDVSKELAI